MGIKKVYSNNYDNKKIVHFKNGKMKSVYAKKFNISESYQWYY